MAKFKFRTPITSCIREMKTNPKIRMESVTTQLPMKKAAKQLTESKTPQELLCLHGEMDGLTVLWTSEDDPEILGAVKILPASEIFQDWEEVVYFDFTPEDDRIRYFRPIDFFADECSVGAYFNEPDTTQVDTSVYLYRFEGEPVNLCLNMPGYLKMLVASKGFLYWQYAVLELLDGEENPTSQKFKQWMPQLFEDFSWDSYVSLYSEVRTGS